MLFQLAYWLILGGALYLILDAIPNGPLAFKFLSKFSSLDLVSIKIILLVGTVLLVIQLALFSHTFYHFYYEDSPMHIGSKAYLVSAVLAVPLITQLFRINAFRKRTSGKLIIAVITIGADLFFRFFNPYTSPRRYYDSNDLSFVNQIQNNVFFHYLCSMLLFFIILDIFIVLKKNNIFKT